MRNLIRGLIAALSLATLPVVSDAGVFVGVSVNIAPPELPVYVQPAPPAAGYLWIPGYWAWGDEDYYWVPGTWALAPSVGLLWTPGYWGWDSGVYIWNGGYWGRHVGFYGGVNYGFGYFGDGYAGGRWRGDQFYYNRSVTNVSTTNITNVYNTTVVNNTTVNRVSFNGGSGGVAARPNAAQLAAQREHHVGFTPGQRLHEQKARGDNSLRASVNGGRPPIAATQKPAVFSGRGVVAAHGASPAGREPRAPAQATNRSDRPSQAQRPATANHAGSAQTDRPSQAQRPATANHAAGPQTDRPPQAQRPAMANHAAGAQTDRPPQTPRPTDRPIMNQQSRERGNAAAQSPRAPNPGAGRAGPEGGPRAAPGYPQPQARAPAQPGAAPPGGAPAHQAPARERQAAPRPGNERPEERGRGQ
jgi:hypothetical protein